MLPGLPEMMGGQPFIQRTSKRMIRSILKAVTVALWSPAFGHSMHAQERPGDIIHPDKASLRALPIDRIARTKAAHSRNTTLGLVVAALRDATPIDSFGSLDGPLESVMGIIRDATVTPDGKAFVIDRSNKIIRIVNLNTGVLSSYGRVGSGPGDFTTPVSAWSVKPGQLTVLDGVLGLKHLVEDKRPQWREDRVSRLRTSASAACGSAEKTYLIEMSGSPGGVAARPIVALSASGRELARFGTPYDSPNALVRLSMAEGVIGCMADGTVLASLIKLPFVSAYSSLGTLKWRIRFEDFHVGKYIERSIGPGRVRLGLDPEDPTSSVILQIRQVAENFAVIQIGTMTPKSLKDRTIWESIDTYAIDVASGTAAFVTSELPLIAGTHKASLVAFENDPFPRVVAYRLGNSWCKATGKCKP